MSDSRGRGLPILTYHAFAPKRSVTAVEPSWFVETMDRLLESGHRPVDLADWIERGRPDEPRAFALAFDDGLASLLNVAEAIAARDLKPTVFLVTDRVGTDNDWPGQPAFVRRERLLDWSELEALGRLGFRFGSHGCTHLRLDDLTAPEIEEELRRSRNEIEARLDRPCRLLAYPYGRQDERVRQAARWHYAAAFGTDVGYAGRDQDPLNLRRIDAFDLRSESDRTALIDDRWRPRLRWKGVVRAWRRSAEWAVSRMGVPS